VEIPPHPPRRHRREHDHRRPRWAVYSKVIIPKCL